MNLDKDPSSWERVSPEAVLSGSEAERVNLLAMAKHDIRVMDEEIRKMRRALLMAAPSHQGGHSDNGAAIAECLGIPFPVTLDNLLKKARSEGLDPKDLWPWLFGRRGGVRPVSQEAG